MAKKGRKTCPYSLRGMETTLENGIKEKLKKKWKPKVLALILASAAFPFIKPLVFNIENVDISINSMIIIQA